MRLRLTGFLRQTSNAVRASKRASRQEKRRGKVPPPPPTPQPPPPPPPSPPTPALLVIDGVTVEYMPRMDGHPDPGEVVWAWVPFEEDPSQGKDRPVVVIGHRGTSLIGIPLTSKEDDRDPQVPVGTGPWDREGRPSWARLDRVMPLDPHQVRREGAALARDRFDAVIDGLRRVHH